MVTTANDVRDRIEEGNNEVVSLISDAATKNYYAKKGLRKIGREMVKFQDETHHEKLMSAQEARARDA